MPRRGIKKSIIRGILSLHIFFLFQLFLLPLDFLSWLKEQDPSKWEYERITPYVYYKKISISEIPLSIHILKVYWNRNSIKLELQKADNGIFGRKTLREIIDGVMKRGENVIAGVNASFFEEDGRPVGLFVDEGIIYNLSNRRSSFIKTSKGDFLISKTSIEITLQAGRERIRIKVLNRENNPDAISLFTHVYNRKIMIKRGYTGILVKIGGKRFSPTEEVKGYVSEVIKDREVQLKEGEVLVMAKNSERIIEKIKAKSPVLFKIRNLYFKDDIEFAVTGAPQIVRKGLNVYKGLTEGLTSKFTDVRHPRTGIGITKDKKRLFLIAVDGRQPNLSMGMTLKELAELFIKLGCYNSLNLDGGGSTTMWVKGRVVNSPSDPTGERPISDAILIIEKPAIQNLKKSLFSY